MTTNRIILKDGPTFSRIVSGMWRLADWQYSVAERVQFIRSCMELAISTFDHADIYGDYQCEALFGEALKSDPSMRDRMQLVTKCGIKILSKKYPTRQTAHYDTSRAHIVLSVEASLARLGTDRIDTLLIHRPDPLMDADEVAEAFSSLRQTGKVLHFGVSNFTPSQFDLLQSRLPFPLVTNQVECSVLDFDVMHDGTLDHCYERNIAPMAWSPMGQGRLFSGSDEQSRRVRTELLSVGEEVGATSIDQVALAWLLTHPSRLIPVVGTGRIDRIRSAVEALDLSLSREQWFRIWQASRGHRVP